MREFDLNPEIVCQIISRCREFQAKEEVVFPEKPEELSLEDHMQILADHKNDLTSVELQRNINDLEPDQQSTLIALMYLGRGDFSIDEWDNCWTTADQEKPSNVARYLLAHPQIVEYLQDGLEAFGHQCEE